jgi:hypothetical protein
LTPSLSGNFVECISGYTNIATRSPFAPDDDEFTKDTAVSNATTPDESKPETVKREL